MRRIFVIPLFLFPLFAGTAVAGEKLVIRHEGATLNYRETIGYHEHCLEFAAKKNKKFAMVSLAVGPVDSNGVSAVSKKPWELFGSKRESAGGRAIQRFHFLDTAAGDPSHFSGCLTGTDRQLQQLKVEYAYEGEEKVRSFVVKNLAKRFGDSKVSDEQKRRNADVRKEAKKEVVNALLGTLLGGGKEKAPPVEIPANDPERRNASKHVDASNIFMQSSLPTPSRVIKVNYSRHLMTDHHTQYITVQPDLVVKWTVAPSYLCFHAGSKRNVRSVAVLATYPAGEEIGVKAGPKTKYQHIRRDLAGSGGQSVKLLGAWNPEAQPGPATLAPEGRAPGIRICPQGPGSDWDHRMEGFDDAVIYVTYADGEVVRLERDDAAPLYQPGFFDLMPEKTFNADNLVVVSGSPQPVTRPAGAPPSPRPPARNMPRPLNTGIVPPPPPASNGRTRLGGGALDIQYWQEESGGKTMYCFDIRNPTGRAVDEIEIGIGPVKIPFASGQAMWTRDRIQDWNVGPRANAPEQRQTLRFSVPGYAKGKPSAAREHIGKACFGATPWLAPQLPDMSQLQYSATFH